MFSNQILERCRNVNLADFLLKYDNGSWRVQGKYLRHIDHDSCVVDTVSGYWYWNSKGEFGRNIINFLQIFYGLSFPHAIKTICSECQIEYTDPIDNPVSIKKPTRVQSPWPELYDYLCRKRMLDYAIIRSLVSDGIVFLSQYKSSKNIVFSNKDSQHYEITGIGEKRFKLCSDSDSYWSFKTGDVSRAYICESAIDAISLYEIIKKEGTYISVCGSANRIKLINSISEEFSEVYLAVDNDFAGNKAASMLPKLNRLIPVHKDWNEDLIIQKQKESQTNA